MRNTGYGMQKEIETFWFSAFVILSITTCVAHLYILIAIGLKEKRDVLLTKYDLPVK